MGRAVVAGGRQTGDEASPRWTMLLLVPHPPTPPPAHCRSEHNGWGWGDPGSHDWQEVHLLCTGCSYLLVCSEPLASYQRQSAAAGWGGG